MSYNAIFHKCQNLSNTVWAWLWISNILLKHFHHKFPNIPYTIAHFSLHCEVGADLEKAISQDRVISTPGD